MGNPFGSDFEDESEEEVVLESKKQPLQPPSRKKRHAPPPPTMTSSPIPSPRTSLHHAAAPPRPPPPSVSGKMGGKIKKIELERQGVGMEKTIREVCEKSDKEREEAGLDNNDRDSLGPQAEDLIVQLFELVNEKNE